MNFLNPWYILAETGIRRHVIYYDAFREW